MSPAMSLSVIVLTKNSAASLRPCLESVKWADEIVIFDSGSTDKTLSIAKEYTTHVFETDWPGFGPQRIRALAACTKDWVLSLDSDEEVSPELQIIIQTLLKKPPNNIHGHYIKRRLFFYGQPIRFAVGSDEHINLFRREHAAYRDELVHESVIVNGKIAHLPGLIYHNSFPNLDSLIEKMNYYSALGAEERMRRGRKSSFSGALFKGVWMFFLSYILRLGFLDGKAGFILSASAGQSTYYQYLKMIYKNEKKLSI